MSALNRRQSAKRDLIHPPVQNRTTSTLKQQPTDERRNRRRIRTPSQQNKILPGCGSANALNLSGRILHLDHLEHRRTAFGAVSTDTSPPILQSILKRFEDLETSLAFIAITFGHDTRGIQPETKQMDQPYVGQNAPVNREMDFQNSAGIIPKRRRSISPGPQNWLSVRKRFAKPT